MPIVTQGLGLCPHCRHEGLDAHDVHHAGEIVGEDMQCHLGGNFWEAFHQEVGCTHSHLERGEGVFGGFAALAHGLRVLIEALLHGLQDMLMLPARNAPLRTGRAARLEGAVAARIGPIAPQLLPILLVRVVVLSFSPTGQRYTSSSSR